MDICPIIDNLESEFISKAYNLQAWELSEAMVHMRWMLCLQILLVDCHRQTSFSCHFGKAVFHGHLEVTMFILAAVNIGILGCAGAEASKAGTLTGGCSGATKPEDERVRVLYCFAQKSFVEVRGLNWFEQTSILRSTIMVVADVATECLSEWANVINSITKTVLQRIRLVLESFNMRLEKYVSVTLFYIHLSQ
ncbi:hypothetical protein Tco_0605920 [Tanacetum coccineum]